MSSSYQDSSHTELQPTLITSFKLSLKDTIFKYSHKLMYQGLEH